MADTLTSHTQFHVLTIFPAMFVSPFAESIMGRAIQNELIKIETYDIRNYAQGRHRKVDDYPFGGGPGMLMRPEPLFDGVAAIRKEKALGEDVPVILLSPQGRRLTQDIVEQFVVSPDMLLICGRYEGVDERVRKHLATDEISIGDYVLSGGELAAMVFIDAVTRLKPGVVGSIASTQDDSFSTGLIQHPQYTRPSKYRSWSVPNVLLSGNHAEIAKWRRGESLRKTLEFRPDLLDSALLTEADRKVIEKLKERWE